MFGCGVVAAQKDDPTPRTLTERGDVERIANWTDNTVTLVISAVQGQEKKPVNVRAKTARYRIARREVALTMVPDTRGDYTYLVPGDQSFYVDMGDEILACRFFSGPFRTTTSLSKSKGSAVDSDTSVRQLLSTMNDEQLIEKAGAGIPGTVIDLRSYGLPSFFFAKDSGLDAHAGRYVTIRDLEVSDSVLRMRMASHRAMLSAIVWIDLRASRLVRTFLEGRQVFPRLEPESIPGVTR